MPRSPSDASAASRPCAPGFALAAVLAVLALPAPRSTSSAAPTRRAAPAPRAEMFSNANDVEAIALHGGRLYAATGGGVVAWDLQTGRVARKWTAMDGLLGNHAYAIAVCALPAPRIVTGTIEGLNLLDPVTGRWEAMTQNTTPMAANAVTNLAADPARTTLVVGYSYAGVNVLDGKTGAWKHIATVHGLLANRVQGIAISGDGREVWVTAAGGISRIVDGKVQTYSVRDLGVPGALSRGIVVDRAGIVWVVSREGRLLRHANGKWRVYGADEVPGGPLRAAAGLAVAAGDGIWYATSSGELRLVDQAGARATLAGRLPAGVEATGMLAAPDGMLWVATRTGVRGLDTKTGQWRTLTVETDGLGSNQIRALAEARDGTIWIGTDAGAYTVAATGRPRPVTWPNPRADRASVITMFPEADGGIWLGTAGGAGHFDGARWRWLGRPEGLANDTVRSIARDATGRMWFGTQRGLSIWDGRAAKNLTEADGLPSGRINALLAQGPVMYVGAEYSLLRFEGGKLELLDDDAMGVEFESLHHLARVHGDSLALGSSNGLGFIDGRTGYDDPEVYGNAISALATVRGEELWAGTEMTGLFHRVGGRWSSLTIADGLPSNRISAVVIDRRGTLWVGTPDGGLARLPNAQPARPPR